MSEDAGRAIASELQRRGLAAPARLLADAHRPLAPLLSDMAAFLHPFSGVVGGSLGSWLHGLATDSRAVDRLIGQLDAPLQEARPEEEHAESR
ncbi:MAG: hypothetical protein ACRDGV_04620 [Candidatus Limnocylindria bacterium]